MALLQLSVAIALIATVALKPYTVDAPKKILLQHLHVQARAERVLLVINDSMLNESMT